MGLSADFEVWFARGSPELVHGPPSITVKLIGHPAPARELELIIMVEVMAE
jgi:hypothetical protein